MKSSARRDAAVVIALSVAAVFVSVKFDLNEVITRMTRPQERFQLDELPGVLLVVAICLIWFSSRRYFEAKRQLERRRDAESRLADALRENQRLARKNVDTQEYERKALARDLHDELGQYVNAIKLDAVAMRDTADDPTVQTTARMMIVNIDRVYAVLAGLIRQLRPVGFDELGVVAALEHCVNDWRSRLPAMSIELTVLGDFESLGESRGLVLYRVVQEALTNAARHSSATTVTVHIERAAAAQHIDILVADNGRGADLSAPRSGVGLIGMRERVAAAGGSVTLIAERGAGFKVRASLPSAAS